MNATLIFIMVAVAIGGVAWVFIFPLLSGGRNAERRMANVARKEPAQQRSSRSNQKSRREQGRRHPQAIGGAPKGLQAGSAVNAA